jgi:hypothetical protein
LLTVKAPVTKSSKKYYKVIQVTQYQAQRQMYHNIPPAFTSGMLFLLQLKNFIQKHVKYSILLHMR